VVIEIYGITIMQNRIAMAASGGAVCITIALLGTLIAIDGKNQLKKLQAEGLDAKGY
jgi:hypothetical protein